MSQDKPKPKLSSAKRAREDLLAAQRNKPLPPDPLSASSLRTMGLRLGIPVAIAWVLAFLVQGWIVKAIVGVLTVVLTGVILWALRFARKSRALAQIVKDVDTPEARKEAIEKLDVGAAKGDAQALVAKAQLEMQEDPRAALKTLEKINLGKMLPASADEARAQRAMIHLTLGETDEARSLCDAVDLSRHKQAKTKAMLVSILGEAFARSGSAKKAIEMLETFDPDDPEFEDQKPQLLRARAFAYAWASDTKQMKQTLRRLSALNPQYLAGFVTRKKHPAGVSPRGVHPLLEKEAFDMASRSGLMGRKVEYRRG